MKKKSKNLLYFLTDIYGINIFLSKKICKTAGYDYNILMINLTEFDINYIKSQAILKLKIKTDTQVKKFIYDNISKLKNIRNYKGIRHQRYLPVNGQRTHTNAKTRKKKRI